MSQRRGAREAAKGSFGTRRRTELMERNCMDAENVREGQEVGCSTEVLHDGDIPNHAERARGTHRAIQRTQPVHQDP
jgi:hypothetical protein